MLQKVIKIERNKEAKHIVIHKIFIIKYTYPTIRGKSSNTSENRQGQHNFTQAYELNVLNIIYIIPF